MASFWKARERSPQILTHDLSWAHPTGHATHAQDLHARGTLSCQYCCLAAHYSYNPLAFAPCCLSKVLFHFAASFPRDCQSENMLSLIPKSRSVPCHRHCRFQGSLNPKLLSADLGHPHPGFDGSGNLGCKPGLRIYASQPMRL